MGYVTLGIIVFVINSVYCLASSPPDFVKINFPETFKDPGHDGKTKLVCDNLNYTKQCFSANYPFFHPLFRPVSVLPDISLTTRFLLCTRKNTKSPYSFLPDKHHLQHSNYTPGKPVTVLVHGFRDSYNSFVPAKDELLAYDDRNVFLIDWEKAASGKYYQAVANSRVVAHRIKNLLLFLMEKAGLKSHDIHLIGVSLGAQLAGAVGKNVKNLGRITGLDPSNPYFANMPRQVHLYWEDALFVDTIRTNAGLSIYEGMGYLGQVGHADFFVNGGNHQPQCDKKPFLPNEKIGTYFSNLCSHGASIDFFTSSIRTCKYEATACIAYSRYKEGNCKKEPTNQMGFFAKKPKYLMFYTLDTEKKPPHCQMKI